MDFFCFLVADTQLYLAVLVSFVVGWLVQIILLIVSNFCITAPAQPSETVLRCSQPCFAINLVVFIVKNKMLFLCCMPTQ